MSRRLAVLASVGFLGWTGGALAAQRPAAETERFVSAARAATARFHDRSAAVAAGYRLVGPDFPGMGEHWIHPPLLFRGDVDPARPAVLSYVQIDGDPRLIGVGYALAVGPEDTLPDVPAGRQAWHFHHSTVEAESFGAVTGEPGGTRLALVHAWIWLENPAGTFARDNWALPYVRAGLAPPVAPDAEAARALGLAFGNQAFYQERFRLSSRAPAGRIAAAVEQASAQVERVVRARAAPEVRDRQLARIWRELCRVTAAEGCEGGTAHH